MLWWSQVCAKEDTLTPIVSTWWSNPRPRSSSGILDRSTMLIELDQRIPGHMRNTPLEMLQYFIKTSVSGFQATLTRLTWVLPLAKLWYCQRKEMLRATPVGVVSQSATPCFPRWVQISYGLCGSSRCPYLWVHNLASSTPSKWNGVRGQCPKESSGCFPAVWGD